MSKSTEDRLRDALQARAEQVTPESLRPGHLPKPRPTRKFSWHGWLVPTLAGATAAVAAVVAFAVLSDSGVQPAGPPTPSPTAPRPTTVTGSACPAEQDLIAKALGRSTTLADIDGDGTPDTVAVAADAHAGNGCRAFVGVRTADGSTYSTALDASAVPPPGTAADVIGLPDLGDDPGHEIVVDTHARADGALAQLFTFRSGRLVRVAAPAFEDGNFYVEGGGVTNPLGADCTADGSLVISMASAVSQGRQFEVTRQVYGVHGDDLRWSGPKITTRTVPGPDLVTEFSEFGSPHFEACDGAVAR